MLEQDAGGRGGLERVQEEEAGWGSWCAQAEPEPDVGTDVLAWPDLGGERNGKPHPGLRAV